MKEEVCTISFFELIKGFTDDQLCFHTVFRELGKDEIRNGDKKITSSPLWKLELNAHSLTQEVESLRHEEDFGSVFPMRPDKSSDLTTMKIEERVRWRAQEELLILKGLDQAIENRVWASVTLRPDRDT